MKTMLLISVLFAISIAIPVSSFAEEPIVCTFGDETTSLDNLFEKDFAVKAFVEKHHDATKSIPTDEFDSAKNQLVLQAQKDNAEERLEIRFHTDANGCHIPASYHYSYDDGVIDVTVRNSVANFTEIMNLIESDDLGIEDFYPDDCTFVDLDVAMSNGKSYGICKEGTAVTILIDAADDGSLQVNLPIETVYSLPSSDCVPTGDFFVMMDNEETHYEITPTETGNLVKVEFPEGFHKINISGSVIIPNPSPAQYCGIVEGYLNKKYLAPLDQTDHGVASKSIMCNDGLTLVQKYDDTPACVKPETKEKLEQRGWLYHKETLLILDDDQQDIGRYLKQASILDESSIDATVSYPTNTAHHKMFPDEYQSIVSDCTENSNGASLSLLYLKEIDNVQNKMTFKVEDKKFDGLQCDDALWQELTWWGYCGPPDYVIPHIDVVVSSVADAQRQVGFVFDVPKYLPEGYDIQKVTVGRDNDRSTLYISPEPITDETQACDFAWGHEGIYLFYGVHPEILSFGSSYSDAPGEPQTWPVTINGNPGKAEQRWVGDRFGMPIPQSSDLQVSIPDNDILVQMSSSLPVEELIRIAESIADPIFNSDIIPDYSRIALQAKTSSDDDNSISVKITGNTSKQICNKIKMACDDGHFFSAMYDMHADTATLEQSVSYNNYVLEISNRELCYKINGDPSDYCSFLNADYSSILDGNKPAMLSQPLDFWKNTSREEQLSFHEEYGDLFFEELGKMVLKDEIKKELERQNIANANNDFRLHTGMVEESLPPYVHYATVINSTDGKSHMFGGRTHTNQILDVYHEELIFYDDVSAKHPTDSFRNDSPVIVIRPEIESDANTDKMFVNFDKNQDVTFVNSLSVPIRIQDKGSGNPEKEHELAWIGPTMKPNETWIFQINSTGYYEWNAKIAPTESGGWWEPHESGDLMAYSGDMSDMDFNEKLRIAGEFVMDSEIPAAGIGMGNSEGLRIGFSSAIIEMLPDAKTYYMERAKQVIPFDVPIIFLN